MSHNEIAGRVNKRSLHLAAASSLISLLLGVTVYVLDRDWETVLFLESFSTWQPGISSGFGRLGLSLPSFFHAYGFALLITLALGSKRRSAVAGAAGWFSVATLLEICQSEPAGNLFLTAQHSVRTSLFGYPVEAYVVNGSFDTGDILAAAVGCLAAGAVAFTLEVPNEYVKR